MRIARAGRKKARIDIIPMIDTMFFVVVFFVIATLSMTVQKGISVNLPSAESTSTETRDRIALTIKPNGLLYWNKDPVDLSDAKQRLQQARQKESDPVIVINADRDVRHGRVIEVMDAVRQSGITNMSIAVKPKPPAP